MEYALKTVYYCNLYCSTGQRNHLELLLKQRNWGFYSLNVIIKLCKMHTASDWKEMVCMAIKDNQFDPNTINSIRFIDTIIRVKEEAWKRDEFYHQAHGLEEDLEYPEYSKAINDMIFITKAIIWNPKFIPNLKDEQGSPLIQKALKNGRFSVIVNTLCKHPNWDPNEGNPTWMRPIALALTDPVDELSFVDLVYHNKIDYAFEIEEQPFVLSFISVFIEHPWNLYLIMTTKKPFCNGGLKNPRFLKALKREIQKSPYLKENPKGNDQVFSLDDSRIPDFPDVIPDNLTKEKTRKLFMRNHWLVLIWVIHYTFAPQFTLSKANQFMWRRDNKKIKPCIKINSHKLLAHLMMIEEGIFILKSPSAQIVFEPVVSEFCFPDNGGLRITSHENQRINNAKRFFSILLRLNYDMKQVVCRRAAGSMKDTITFKELKAAFKIVSDKEDY